MSAVLVQTTGKQQRTATTAATETFNAGSAFTPGNVVIIAGSFSTNANPVVTIAGTVATKVVGQTFAANGDQSYIFVATIVNGSRTDVTVLTDTVAHYMTFSIDEWSGVTLPVDKTNHSADGGTVSNSPAAGTTGTMSQNDELIYSVFCNAATQTSITAPGGYTKVWEELNSAAIQGGAGGYKVTAVGGAENPAWTTAPNADNWWASVATFPAGAVIPPPTETLMGQACL